MTLPTPPWPNPKPQPTSLGNQPRCKEKSCPFPLDGSDGFCGYHRAMFSCQDSTEELLAEVQPRRNTGRHNGSDIGRPEAMEALRGGQVWFCKGLLDRINYRENVRLRKCVNCWKPLDSNETRKKCQTCRSRSSRKYLQRQKRRRDSCLCTKCGQQAAATGRRFCLFCCQRNRGRKYQARRKSLGLPKYKLTHTSRENDANTTREKRREIGLCLRCGDPKVIISGRRVCNRCIARQKSRREKKGWRSGICMNCCRRPVVANLSQCFECRQRSLKTGRERYHRRKREGLCTRCGHKGDGKPMRSSLCSACYAKLKEKAGRKVSKRWKAGLCRRCGKFPAEPGSLCKNCRNRAKDQAKRDRIRQSKKASAAPN